tara:strand:- start:402 stop:557 length:156 start_codon:yes stop_codon:yes gene_type:complete
VVVEVLAQVVQIQFFHPSHLLAVVKVVLEVKAVVVVTESMVVLVVVEVQQE